MESFFEFIYGNIFIVVIIVAALFNLFNKNKKAQQEEQTEQRPPAKPSVNQERQQERRPVRAERSVEQVKQTIKTVKDNVTKTIEEQRQDQYDRLKSQYATSSMSAVKDIDDAYSIVKESTLQPEQKESIKVKVKLEEKLTPSGLIESVIMAEVLGPPRARDPYRNLVVKRKQR